MADPLFPNGYGGSPQGMSPLLTIQQISARKSVSRLHPEFRRRVFRFMEHARLANVPLGIGTGWRVQPTTGGIFVRPGNSYHEGFMPDNRSKPNGRDDTNAMACDMVPEPTFRGAWYNGNIARFGLRHMCHYKNECWHIQPVEIPASRNFATRMPSLLIWDLPGDKVTLPPYDPWKNQWGLFPVNPNKPALVNGTGYTPGTQHLQSTIQYFAHVAVFKCKMQVSEVALDPGVFDTTCINVVRAINARYNLDGHNRALAVEAFQGFCGAECWKLIDHLATGRVPAW